MRWAGRTAGALAVLAAWTLAAAFEPGAVERRVWSGKGLTGKASEGANWIEGAAPRGGERVLFGSTSDRDCEWDYDVKLSSLTLTHGYAGRVSLGGSKVEVEHNVRVAGGKLDLAAGTLTVRDRVYVDWGGVIEMGRGELRLGPRGLLVDNEGDFRSTGDKPARITASGDHHYPFVVGFGKVRLDNPAGTTVAKSQGIVLYSSAEVAKAANVRVEQVAPGSAAVKLFPKKDQKVELKDWSFDETVVKKVEVPEGALKQGEVVLVEQPPAASAPEEVAVSTAAPEAEPEEVVAPPPLPPLDSGLTFEEEGVKITPLFNVTMLGGQYFFKGEKGNLSGNASVLASPTIRFNERWTLVPTYVGAYQGTKQVVDVTGAGSLFQQRMDHRLGAKGVFTPGGSGPWRIKPAASYKVQLLEETRDEKWGEGLFDYQRYGAGLEAEYVYRDPFSLRAGYDYSFTRFPNYTTLESQQTFDFNGKPLARELVGGHVLDSAAHSLTLGGSAEIRRGWLIEGTYVYLLQDYPNQRLVDASGNLVSTLRKDDTHLVDLTLRNPRQPREGLRLLSTLGLSASMARSNQNTYDALNSRFISGYYDYDEYAARAGMTALFGKPSKTDKPTALGLGVNAAVRRYADRPTQDALGVYRGSKLQQVRWGAGLNFAMPMDANFSVTTSVQYGQSSSNMDFQQFYKYDYTTMHYLFGVTYEY